MSLKNERRPTGVFDKNGVEVRDGDCLRMEQDGSFPLVYSIEWTPDEIALQNTTIKEFSFGKRIDYSRALGRWKDYTVEIINAANR